MPSSAKNVTKAWGVYAYIAGDNNLSDNGLVDIREMCEGGASKDLHVSVQIDTAGDHDGSVRYEITEPDFEGRCHRTVIQRLPEQNTGDPRYLASYLAWASQRYPARRRLFVVWNHGAGFMHEPTKDIGYDDSSGGDALTMAELRWALEKAGYGGKERLAILGFDACLMNMLEVAYEFAGVADFIVGSQQTEPGDGWPYRQVVSAAQGNPSPRDLAVAIVKAYAESYRHAGVRNITQSALELAKLEAVAVAVDALGRALRAALPQAKGAILEARVGTQGYEEPTYVDLVDLVRRLAKALPGGAVASACRKVESTVGHAVLERAAPGRAVARSSGLSIWFPLLSTDYVSRRSEYVALRLCHDHPGWAAFLDRLLAH